MTNANVSKRPTSLDSVPLHYRDATALAEQIAGGFVSSRDVVQAYLDRIEEVNPKINAIVTLRADAALRDADDADRAVADGREIGPLHGVPFTVKDALDTAGLRTQRGSKLFADFIPDFDATAVARFKSAGGIPIAKTNLPEFSSWFETDNLVTGRTNNPWRLARTPGGSSGGEAAALAAGMSPIGIGSDVAISVRGPAALTGVTALKATHGRIPFTGHYPTATSAWWHVGPMARTVRDVALGYHILSGPDGRDGYAVHDRLTNAACARIPGQSIRVGWVSEDAFEPVDAEISAAVADAAARLADLGCSVEQVAVPFIREADALTTLMTLVNAELVPHFKALAAGREELLSPIGIGIIKTDEPTLDDVLAARRRMETLRSAFARYFGQFDLLLCPVTPFTAQPHGLGEVAVNGTTVPASHVMDATSVFNLTGLPAVSVPYGFSSDELPIGVQLVSRWFDESTALRLGGLLERKGGLGDRRPPIEG